MKQTKEKKLISPNECSFGRWIVVLLVGLVIGFLPSIFFAPYSTNTTDTIMGITYANFFSMLSFIPLFWGMVLAIKLIGKTSLKDFVLGVGGKMNVKLCLIIAGLYAVGLSTPCLIMIRNLRMRDVDAKQYAFLLVFMLLTTWMQTSFEELVFRGIVIRWACKNDVRFTKKAMIAALISSVAFAIAHVSNPEVTSQKGIYIVLATITYAIPAFLCFVVNLQFGNLLPGLIIHWVNNLILFTVISEDVAAMPVQTLFVDTTPHSAVWMLASTVISYVPVLIFMLVVALKRKKED